MTNTEADQTDWVLKKLMDWNTSVPLVETYTMLGEASGVIHRLRKDLEIALSSLAIVESITNDQDDATTLEEVYKQAKEAEATIERVADVCYDTEPLKVDGITYVRRHDILDALNGDG